MSLFGYFQVYNNISTPAENITLCGFNLPESIISTKNKITMVLKTDESMAYGGYETFYYVVETYNSMYFFAKIS